MNKINLAVFFLAFVSGVSMAQQSVLRCGNELDQQDVEVLLEKETLISNWIDENANNSFAREEFVIPVVVHVLYSNEEEKISPWQVRSQIAVLNEDYNDLNTGTDLIPLEFRSLKANVGFTFCLATTDPNGLPSDGIIYQETTTDCIANALDTKTQNNRAKLYYSDEGGSSPWDPTRYLNIWVGNTCQKFLGKTASFDPAFPNEDGVIIDYHYFGTGCTQYPFHLGRTTTHEVGHYFGLNHIFSGSSCDSDDGVEDTPQQAFSYSGCPRYPQSSCDSRDMFMNFMDYVDDSCMKLFTEGQKLRMIATLKTQRSGLLDYGNCELPKNDFSENITVFPNPAQQCVYVNLDEEIIGPVNVRLFDAKGQLFYERESTGNFIQPIPVDTLPVGIYFLRIEYEGGSETERVMVVGGE